MVGDGEIRLGPEELDLSIKGKPKKLRFFRLKTPVELNGHLRKPSIGIERGSHSQAGSRGHDSGRHHGAARRDRGIRRPGAGQRRGLLGAAGAKRLTPSAIRQPGRSTIAI